LGSILKGCEPPNGHSFLIWIGRQTVQ